MQQPDYHLKQALIYGELAALARTRQERCRYLDLAAYHELREASPRR